MSPIIKVAIHPPIGLHACGVVLKKVFYTVAPHSHAALELFIVKSYILL